MADQQQPGLLANILAVAGFIILILIIVWGAYNLLRLTGTGLSGFFSGFGSTNSIEVTAPTTPVESGAAFPLSWQYEPAEGGTYAILYQCSEGFSFDMQTSDGRSGALPCGNAYGIGEVSSVSLTPTLTGADTRDVPLTIIFVPSATSTDERPQGSAEVTVVAASETPETPVETAEPTVPPASETPPAQTGRADLSVRIIGVGVIDSATGIFVQRTPGPSDTAAVQFDIKNNGGSASGAYRFNVQLPTQPVYPYISPAQASLAPGAHVVSTLRFGPVAPQGGTIAIEVDAARAVKDSNRGNNTAAIWMNATGYPYYYQAPFVY